MGIDAIMAAELGMEVPDEVLEAENVFLAKHFGDAFYKEPMTKITEPEKFGFSEWCGERTLYPPAVFVNLSGRHFSAEYRRGTPWLYVIIAEWLEARLPVKQVYYGNDQTFTLDPFGKAERREMMAAFYKHGLEYYYEFSPNRHDSPLHKWLEQGLKGSEG